MHVFVQAFKKHWLLMAIFGGIFIVATGLIIYTTCIAPWAFSDSTTYLWTARNVASGLGLVIQNPAGSYEPSIWFPPLYSLLISIPVSFGADALQTARWFNAVAFGLLTVLASSYIWTQSKSKLFSLGTAVIFIVSPYLIKISSGAISEPIFLVFTFISLFSLILALQKPEGMLFWLLGSLAAGLSFLTRYVGIAVMLTFLFFAILTMGSVKMRFKRIALVVLTSGIPAIIWILYAVNKSGSVGGRHFSFPPDWFAIVQQYFHELWGVVLTWIPYVTRGNQIIPEFVKVLFLILCMGIVVIYTVRERSHPAATFGAVVLGTFVMMYITVHLSTYVVVNEQPDAEIRLFLPIYLGTVLLFLTIFAMLVEIKCLKNVGKGIFIFSLLVFLLYFNKQTTKTAQTLHSEGYGYSSAFWQKSALVEEIKALKYDSPTFSNDAALVLFYTGNFPKQISLIECINVDSSTAISPYLILFRPQAVSIYGEEAESSFKELNEKFQVIYEDVVGTIYYAAPENSSVKK